MYTNLLYNQIEYIELINMFKVDTINTKIFASNILYNVNISEGKFIVNGIDRFDNISISKNIEKIGM